MSSSSRPSFSAGDPSQNPGVTIHLRDSTSPAYSPYHIHPHTTARQLLTEIATWKPACGLTHFLSRDDGKDVEGDCVLQDGDRFVLNIGILAAGPGDAGASPHAAHPAEPTTFVNPEQEVKITPDPFGAPWRVIREGVIFRSKCQTSSCAAFQHTIYVNKGFGTINVIQCIYVLVCPICTKRAALAENMGFYRAKFTFDGMTKDNVEYLKSGQTEAGEYLTYPESGDSQWVFLNVKTEPLT